MTVRARLTRRARAPRGPSAGLGASRVGQASGGRERAWEYFRCMQNIDAANVRHYTKMLQTCNDASEIDGLMAELDRSGIRPNAGTAPLVFSATHSVSTDCSRAANSDLHDAAQGLRSPGHVCGGRQRVEDSPAQGSARHQWRR